MTRETITVLDMELEEWVNESCRAEFGTGPDWATLYSIHSLEPGKGHATALLREAKAIYEAEGRTVAGSVALNDTMRHLYEKTGITEHAGEGEF